MKPLKGKIVLVLAFLAILLLMVAAGYYYFVWKSNYDLTETGNTPMVPNAYLLVNIVDKNGDPVSDCTLIVRVEYEPPDDYHNYSYEVRLDQATGNMIGLLLPPVDRPSAAKIVARRPCGSTSQEYSITNAEYWQKVESSTTGYAEEITFVMEDCE